MAVPITARAAFQAHIDGIAATGLVDLSLPISTAWWFDDAAANIDIIDFPAGPSSLKRPPKGTMVILIPPPTNVVIPVLGGKASDAGIPLIANAATILPVASASPVLSWPSAVAGVRVIWL